MQWIVGRCYLTVDDKISSKSWKCNVTCREFCGKDRQSVIDLKNAFTNESVEKIRDLLENVDCGCEHGHYSKPYDVDMEDSPDSPSHLNQFKELKGHPLPVLLAVATAGYVYFELVQCTIQV